jgi:hypothetical protein
MKIALTPPKRSRGVSSYKTLNFACEIVMDRDKKRVRLKNDRYYYTEINKFKLGDSVSMYITSKKASRTDRQNRYYWLYIANISRETGNDKDELHTLFKNLFLKKYSKEIYGHKIIVTKSTTDLSSSDFIDYIKRIEIETGILSPPTEVKEETQYIDYPVELLEPTI